MKNALFFTTAIALILGLSGCATPAESPADSRSPLFNEFLEQSAEILEAGGLAVIGIAESKSLEIAVNRAKTDGRKKLADLLEERADSLRIDFTEEIGLDRKDPLLDPFDQVAQTISANQIRNLIAKELQYETLNDTVTAYALMEISPQVIVDQIAKNEELALRFGSSKTAEKITRGIKDYEAYKTSQQM